MLLGAAWEMAAQSAPEESRILDRAVQLHARNPLFQVSLKTSGPFELGERIFVDSNLAEISKRLYPPSHASDHIELQLDRQSNLHFQYAGGLLEGPFDCGDFKIPCAYDSFQRGEVLGRRHFKTPFSPINAVLPPLKPGKYRLALLLVLRDIELEEAESKRRISHPASPSVPDEERYLVSNVLEFEVLPLNPRWVDRRIGELSAMPPPFGWKPKNLAQRGGMHEAILPLDSPLAELLFLPTEAALTTAYEYYVETGFDPILATFYYHPDLELSCRYLQAQIAGPHFPLVPKILQQTPHVCVDAKLHFQRFRELLGRQDAAYRAALQVRFDEYDRIRLRIARLTVDRFLESPEDEVALQGLIVAIEGFYRQDLAADLLADKFAAVQSALQPRLRTYSSRTQQQLLQNRLLLPEALVITMAVSILDEPWPESACQGGDGRQESQQDSGIELRRLAFRKLVMADPDRAKALAEKLLARLDPALEWNDSESLPFTVSVPEDFLNAATLNARKQNACGRGTSRSTVLLLHYWGMPLDSLEAVLLNSEGDERAIASSVLLRRDPARYAQRALDLIRSADKGGLGLAMTLLYSHQQRREVPGPLLEEMGLELLQYTDRRALALGARALRYCGKNYKQQLLERYKAIDSRLVASTPQSQSLEFVESEFRDAIAHSTGWVTTSEELVELDQYCDFRNCKRSLLIDLQYLHPSITLQIHPPDRDAPFTRISFAQYRYPQSTLYDNADTLELIRRYPRTAPIRIHATSKKATRHALQAELDWLTRLRADGFIDVEITTWPD